MSKFTLDRWPFTCYIIPNERRKELQSHSGRWAADVHHAHQGNERRTGIGHSFPNGSWRGGGGRKIFDTN